MMGKRRRPSHPDREVGSAAPSPSRAQVGLAPVLLRAATALVEHEGAGTPPRRREPIYRSPHRRTHPHLRARGGSFRRRRPPRPAPAVQREIVGPLLQPLPSPLRLGAPSVLPPDVSLQSSQQLSSGVAAPPLPLSPAPLRCRPHSLLRRPPPLAPPPLSSSAGAPLVSHPSSPLPSASPPPVEPPQRQHPLGREWDIQSDVVKDILRWEKRMVAVGECMSHVATVLEQLHAGLVARNLVLRDPQLTEPQQGVVREAAAQGLWRLLHLPMEPEFPEQDKGPGARAFRRVAKAAEESPLELVPTLAVLLRWMRPWFYRCESQLPPHSLEQVQVLAYRASPAKALPVLGVRPRPRTSVPRGLRVLRAHLVLRPPALLSLYPSVVSCYPWFRRARSASTAFVLLEPVPKSPHLGVANAAYFVVLVLPILLLPSLLSSLLVAPRVLQLHPLPRQSPGERKMETDALALMAASLVAASPGGVPGRQVPALLQAASVLAGHGAFSPSSRVRRNKWRKSQAPVFHYPPGRAPACLRPRQHQSFRRTQRWSAQPLHSGVPPVASLPPPRPPQSPPPRAVTANLPTHFGTPPQPGRAPMVAVTHSGGQAGARLSRRQRRQQSQQQSLPPPSPARDASPRRAARNACGDVLDVAVLRSGPAPHVFGAARRRGRGDVTIGAIGSGVCATEMLHYLPLIGLVPGAPGAALGPGPGAMVRLAESAQQPPSVLYQPPHPSCVGWMGGYAGYSPSSRCFPLAGGPGLGLPHGDVGTPGGVVVAVGYYHFML
ncbi:unnamed protein product [Closterium sp. NIES-64]|nr:unnamed protein product [Closterium sp. NIES-64]